jgi:hypothetical protein
MVALGEHRDQFETLGGENSGWDHGFPLPK